MLGLLVVGCGASAAGPAPREPVGNQGETTAGGAKTEAETGETGETGETAERATAKEEAKRLFADGKAAYDAGDFAEAAKLFERVYAQWPKPEILYNVAQARRMNGDIGLALAALRRMQTMQLSTFMRDEVDRVIKEIEAQYPPNQAVAR